MAEINDTNINAEDVVSGVEVVKKSKKGLIAGGIAVLTAGVVAGGGLAAYSLSDFVKNQVKLRFSSPENYSTWIYEKNADALAEQLATAYEKRLEQLDDGQQMTFSLSYDTTDEAKNGLIDSLGLDEEYDKEMLSIINGLNSIAIGADECCLNSVLSGQFYADVNGDRLISADIAADSEVKDFFFRIPELSEQWIAADGEKLSGENADDYEMNSASLLIDAMQDPRSIIAPEEIKELTSRYVKIWNDSIEDVSLEKKNTVTINDIETNYTIVTVEMSQREASQIMLNMSEAAKDDELLREIIVDRLGIIDNDGYNEEMDYAIESFKDYIEYNDDEKVNVIDTYIDSKGVIRGIGITVRGDEFLAIVGKEGNKISGTCYRQNSDEEEPEYSFDLFAEENNNKYSGSIDFLIEEDESLILEFNDFEVVNEDNGYFNADTVFTYKNDTLEFSLPVSFSADKQGETVKSDIVIEDINYGTVTLGYGAESGAEPSVPSKSNAFVIDDTKSASETIRDYVPQEQMESFLTELFKKLGFNDSAASDNAKSYAEEIYTDWDEYNYDFDDDEFDDNYDDEELIDDDELLNTEDAGGPSVKSGQAYLMVYDEDLDVYSYGDGSDYLSYGAKFADINGNGTYSVGISADTPEYKEHSDKLPNGVGMLMLSCTDTEGFENAEIKVTSLEVDGKFYDISEDMTVEVGEDYFAAMLYSSFFGTGEDETFKSGADLSDIGEWKTIAVTFEISGIE